MEVHRRSKLHGRPLRIVSVRLEFTQDMSLCLCVCDVILDWQSIRVGQCMHLGQNITPFPVHARYCVQKFSKDRLCSDGCHDTSHDKLGRAPHFCQRGDRQIEPYQEDVII